MLYRIIFLRVFRPSDAIRVTLTFALIITGLLLRVSFGSIFINVLLPHVFNDLFFLIVMLGFLTLVLHAFHGCIQNLLLVLAVPLNCVKYSLDGALLQHQQVLPQRILLNFLKAKERHLVLCWYRHQVLENFLLHVAYIIPVLKFFVRQKLDFFAEQIKIEVCQQNKHGVARRDAVFLELPLVFDLVNIQVEVLGNSVGLEEHFGDEHFDNQEAAEHQLLPFFF